jgi:two-component system CheB/CheR fusion protein
VSSIAEVAEQTVNNTLHIVGIGTSAGGVQALQALFEGLPDDTGAAFVVVLHLHPHIQSELASILGARTRMAVLQVSAEEHLQANHVYVIPPDRRLRLTDDRISTAEFEEPRGHRAPIDLFFRSLAEQHGDGFAIILTGAGSDGAIGVKAVKEAGGIIIVQNPGEAEYPSMPRSAIATGAADLVLSVREIAKQLPELIRKKTIALLEDPQSVDEELLRRILNYVRIRTGHDFSGYKRATVTRRIARRVQVTRTDDLAHYCDFLRDNMEEAQALLSDLLISVTTFFRDTSAFDALAVKVLPRLFEERDTGEGVRIWIPGCATGEEVYTIAILLLEEAARHNLRSPIQIFASDLDPRALALAREGSYPTAIKTDVTEDRLRRFFSLEGESYRVKRELRDVVLFANHNLLKDPPFSRLDLISCRNLLIYLARDLQLQTCSTFHYALNPGGFLFLGASEAAESPPGLFRRIDQASRIYQSTAQPGKKPALVPRLLAGLSIGESGSEAGRSRTSATALGEAAAHRLALEKIAPPSILVDAAHRVVHLSDHAGRFLQPSGGPLSGDVTDLVREELRFELRTALHRAFEQGIATLSVPLLVRFNGSPHRVHFHVKPIISEGDGAQPLNAVVMFIEGEAVQQSLSERVGTEQADSETVRQLREELQLTQTRLRSTREEGEAINEELRAANEELQSINEEYRSTSEELETSKEELQSINEELQTVNSELKLKLEAISRAHNDLQNLMAATDFGTLFLDPDLRIKRFTQRVTDLFSITPDDQERFITDFAHQLEYDELVVDSKSVLAQLTPIRREIRSRSGRWYDVRLRPYRTVEDKIDGVIITFVDVSDLLQAKEALKASEQRLRQEKQLVDLSREPIFVWDFDDGILEWNRGCEELYGYSREEALGKNKDELLATRAPGSSITHDALLNDENWSGQLKQSSKAGKELTVESRLQLQSFDGHRLVLESAHDVTEQKAWEQRLRLLLSELTHRVKNTLTIVQAIAHQTERNSPSKQEFITRFDGRLSALASAHSLLVESDWKGAELGALARDQLKPYATDRPDAVLIDGPPISLPPEVATPFGLVLHELATNAAKHGSLSRPTGTVHLLWTVDKQNAQHVLTVKWHEKNGPQMKDDAKPGFGSSLIDGAIPNAVVSREFGQDGLVCTLVLPLPKGVKNGTA